MLIFNQCSLLGFSSNPAYFSTWALHICGSIRKPMLSKLFCDWYETFFIIESKHTCMVNIATIFNDMSTIKYLPDHIDLHVLEFMIYTTTSVFDTKSPSNTSPIITMHKHWLSYCNCRFVTQFPHSQKTSSNGSCSFKWRYTFYLN